MWNPQQEQLKEGRGSTLGHSLSWQGGWGSRCERQWVSLYPQSGRGCWSTASFDPVWNSSRGMALPTFRVGFPSSAKLSANTHPHGHAHRSVFCMIPSLVQVNNEHWPSQGCFVVCRLANVLTASPLPSSPDRSFLDNGFPQRAVINKCLFFKPDLASAVMFKWYKVD